MILEYLYFTEDLFDYKYPENQTVFLLHYYKRLRDVYPTHIAYDVYYITTSKYSTPYTEDSLEDYLKKGIMFLTGYLGGYIPQKSNLNIDLDLKLMFDRLETSPVVRMLLDNSIPNIFYQKDETLYRMMYE